MNVRQQQELLLSLDEQAARRRREICAAADALTVRGVTYYVSADGSDEADGLTEDTPWSIGRLHAAVLQPGDGVRFRRGDVLRGVTIMAQAGVSYGAYGSGEKPCLLGGERNLADETLWELYDADRCVWRCRLQMTDVGTLVFDDGAMCSRKLIPSYIDGRFVCREDESRPFDVRREMTQDLDVYRHYDATLTQAPSHGQDFPIPVENDTTLGTLYLRCDRGNPGRVFHSIEPLPRRCAFRVRANANVHIDNLCIRYYGHHAIAAGGHVVGLHVTNCEIGWIGGTVQHYLGTDPNYPEGGRGTVTRFGNGVEIYGGCEDYLVENCCIYQCYDAGITHQITTNGKKYTLDGICYRNNLVEYCVYSIEYFLDMNMGDEQSEMRNVVMEGNLLRHAGCGWGQQRHNVDTPAHIKGWNYVNRARNFHIRHNVFDRCAYRLLHLAARERDSLPTLTGNTYVQYADGVVGLYGVGSAEEVPTLRCGSADGGEMLAQLRDETGKYYEIHR